MTDGVRRKAEEKESAILQAALRLFAERGFHATSVPLIAAEAGVAVGTLYHYFATKEAIVNHLYRKLEHEKARALYEGNPVSPGVAEQFRNFWQRGVAYAMEQPLAFDFLQMHHHAPYLDEESRLLQARMQSLEGKLFEYGRRAGELKPYPDTVLSAFIGGALLNLIKAARGGRVELSPVVVDQAADCCWDAIRQEAGAAKKRGREQMIANLLAGENGRIGLSLEPASRRDGNCRAAVSIQSWNYRAEGKVWLSLDRISAFEAQLEGCLQSLEGTAEFRSAEDHLQFQVIFERRGQVRVEGSYRETMGEGNEQRFRIETDQSFMTEALPRVAALAEGIRGGR